MKITILATIAIVSVLVASNAIAAPILTVEELGPTPSNDRLWIAQVAPDPSFFTGTPPGGSMAVELAFAIDGAELIGVEENEAFWDAPNPGNNPFTGTVTEGLWVDLIGERTFGAFGSVRLTSADPVDLFLFETTGLGPTTIRYGVAASGDDELGARIAQGGINFDGYTGAVTVIPEPAAALLIGFGIAISVTMIRRRAA
jgi:hypothetical protein